MIWVTGTTPKSGEVGDVFGFPNTGVLARLNAVTLNWNRWRSVTLKFLVMLELNCGAVLRRIFGLRSFAVRSVSGGRIVHNDGEVLNQWLKVC